MLADDVDAKRGSEATKAVNLFVKGLEKLELEGQVRQLHKQLMQLKKEGAR